MHKIWEPASKFIENQSTTYNIPAEKMAEFWIFNRKISNFLFVWWWYKYGSLFVDSFQKGDNVFGFGVLVLHFGDTIIAKLTNAKDSRFLSLVQVRNILSSPFKDMFMFESVISNEDKKNVNEISVDATNRMSNYSQFQEQRKTVINFKQWW